MWRGWAMFLSFLSVLVRISQCRKAKTKILFFLYNFLWVQWLLNFLFRLYLPNIWRNSAAESGKIRNEPEVDEAECCRTIWLIYIYWEERLLIYISNNEKSSLVKELDYDTSNNEACLSWLISGIYKKDKRLYSFFYDGFRRKTHWASQMMVQVIALVERYF